MEQNESYHHIKVAYTAIRKILEEQGVEDFGDKLTFCKKFNIHYFNGQEIGYIRKRDKSRAWHDELLAKIHVSLKGELINAKVEQLKLEYEQSRG